MHIYKHASYLQKVLQQQLPGIDAQMLMAPEADNKNRFAADTRNARKSAVLVLLYPGKHGVSTLLIRRADDGSMHSGQISFPGGKWEPEDKDLSHTALREAEEEVGSNPERLTLLGKLSYLFIPVSNFIVQPFVAMAESKPKFVPNPREVAELITLPLQHILSPDKRVIHTFHVRESLIEAPCFHIDSYQIWGATAMILSEFAEVLRGLYMDMADK